MTLLGAILAAAVLGVLLWRPRRFTWVLLGAAAFPSSAAIVAGGIDLSCYHAAAVVALALVAVQLASKRGRAAASLRLRSLDRWLLAGLLAYALALTAVGPTLFAGLPVFSPRLGIDAQVSAMTPLSYSTSNVAQAVYLVLNAAVVVYLAIARDVSARSFELPIAIVGVVSLAVALLGPLWPSPLFDTMGYRYVTGMGRLRGTFSEPSLLGLFLAGALVYCGVQILRARGLRLVWMLGLMLVLVAAGLLNRSGTLLVALGAWAAATAVLCAIKWVLRAPSPRRVAAVSAVASALTVGAFTPVGSWLILQLSGNKVGSLSFRNRTAADARAFGITGDTLGLGAGLGSNRASSLLATLLSTIGVIGTAVVLVLVVLLVIRGLRTPSATPMSAALVAVAIGQMSSVPDLSAPYIWILLGLIAATTARAPARHIRTRGASGSAASPSTAARSSSRAHVPVPLTVSHAPTGPSDHAEASDRFPSGPSSRRTMPGDPVRLVQATPGRRAGEQALESPEDLLTR